MTASPETFKNGDIVINKNFGYIAIVVRSVSWLIFEVEFPGGSKQTYYQSDFRHLTPLERLAFEAREL